MYSILQTNPRWHSRYARIYLSPLLLFAFLLAGTATMKASTATEAASTLALMDCDGVPTWTAGAVFVGGQEAQLNGTRYRANWWTQGTDPSSGAAVWENLGTCDNGGGGNGGNGGGGGNDGDCGGVPTWSASAVYTGGQRAQLNGRRYEAKWWTQNDNPQDNSDRDGVWRQVGDCGDGGGGDDGGGDDGDDGGDDGDGGGDDGGDDGDGDGGGDDGGGGGGGDGSIPGKILVGYWHNFNNGSTTPRLSEVSRAWDVVNIAFAEPVRGSSSNMTFTPYEIYGGNVQAFRDDVALLKSRGQTVLISIGGANSRVELNNERERREFVNSMTAIINDFGFNGLDIDLEGQSVTLQGGDNDYRNPTTPKVVNLISATKDIRNNIGANRFVLSMAPETAFVQGGYGRYGGIWGAYLPVIHGLRNEMNFLHVQHYNTGSMFGRDGNIWEPATADFHAALMEMMITGFPVAQTGLRFQGLRADQIAIGVPAVPAAAGSGYTSEAVVQQAFDYIANGRSYPGRRYQSAGTYPSLRGIMTWSINWDLSGGQRFSNSHRPFLDGLLRRSLPKTSVNTNTANLSENLQLYPNPVSGDFLQLGILGQLAGKLEAATVRVIDLSGAVVLESRLRNLRDGYRGRSLDVSNLSSGLYHLSVITPAGDRAVSKFVKQ